MFHYFLNTVQSYMQWMVRYIHVHKSDNKWQHPKDKGVPEIEQFLSHLVTDRYVSASTQNQDSPLHGAFYAAVLVNCSQNPNLLRRQTL